MISYMFIKILTVLIVICSSCGEETKCEKTLKTVGLKYKTGFENYSFLMQFDNYTAFEKHVRKMIGSERDNDVLPKDMGYLRTIYETMHDPKLCPCKEMIPKVYCLNELRQTKFTNLITDYKLEESDLFDKYTSTINEYTKIKLAQDIFEYRLRTDEFNELIQELDDYKTRQIELIDKFKQNLLLFKSQESNHIVACTRDITDYTLKMDLENGHVVKKFDEKNPYKNIIASMDLSIIGDKMPLNMKKGVQFFHLYTLLQIKKYIIMDQLKLNKVDQLKLNKVISTFTVSALCKSHFSSINQNETTNKDNIEA